MTDITTDTAKDKIEEATGTNTLNAPVGFEELYGSESPAHQGIKYTLQLYHAVKKAREEYQHFKDGNAIGLQAFMKNINWRPLLSKAEYFDSIGISGEPSNMNVKDSKSIFKSNIEQAKEYVESIDEVEARIYKKSDTTKGKLQIAEWWVDVLTNVRENWTGDVED